MARTRSVIIIAVVLVAAPVALMVLFNTVWREIVVSPVSRPFEQTAEQALGSGTCVQWTVLGTLEGESRSMRNGAKWTLGPSGAGAIDADVLSPRLELAFTDGCGGDAVEIDAVHARWGFAPGCSATDAGLGVAPATESVPSCALEMSFGFDDQGLPETESESASSSFTASNTGQTAELDGTLAIFDSGFVCFDAVAVLTVSERGASDSVWLEMEICT